MVDTTGTSTEFDPVTRPLMNFWSDYANQVNRATRELFSGFEDGSQLKTWNRKWMDAVGQSMDAYMRTPAFLRAMKRQTESAVQVKRKADDLVSEMARNANIPTANDISGLFERLKSTEDAILRRLDDIDGRFAELESQRRVQETG
jgi:hypothetical protein